MGAALEMEIDPRSLQKLLNKLQTDYLIDIPADKFYDSVAIMIGKGAQKRAPVDQGAVQRGIKVMKERDGRSVVATAPHSIYVHEGTRPHWPPIDAVRGWAARHGISPFLVAYAISKKGTKAVPFLAEAAADVFQSLQPSMQSLVAGIEKRWSA